MRVIVTCAGEQTRWANYLGVPKHLAPTGDGEPLLHRTVRQALTISEDVHVTAPLNDPRYEVPGAAVHPTGPVGKLGEYESSRAWWSTTGRTVLLLGDVYFTDEAIATVAAQESMGYWCFGRFAGSELTGKRYGEIFAVSWWRGQVAIIDKHLAHIRRLLDAGKSKRPPGWLLLRSMQHTPLNKHVVSRPWWKEINDLTDDIDHPADWDRHPCLGGARARV